jgi:hypothetical protein
MSEIMKCEVFDLRLPRGPLKDGPEGAIGHSFTVTEDLIALLVGELNRFQGVRQ